MTDLSIVESIFFAALGKSSPQERAEYLDAACGDDVELRRHVERILAARPMAGNFLDGPAPGMDARVEEVPVGEGPGTVIGPYKLMEQIGEGGMGLVFVAEQQYPVRRKVAVKIIKPGMGTRDVIARFEAERQALALMDHPNIARVFEAGATEGGRPYFVMELVKGISIVEYCDQQQLTAGERLELFLSVCQAVQHAHGKGVIHRDLKPSNILVAPHDGIPVVKVIDFGVAKALGQQLTDKTVYTRFTQMIGTPLYMSPEQAEINALDVDIRSDVYSLGVLLYELLTGTTPFDRQRFVTAAYDEIRRIIREEEPPKPSTRLSTLGAGLSAVSARRKTEPAKLSALVKGDLDWMVMKALEKDRGRRYETASAFAADVRRFLNQEPIEARPPSVWYRSCKLAQRNKVALTTVALVAVALVLGTVVSVWQALRAHAAERLALENAEIAREQEQHADDAKQKAEKQRDEFAALNETLRRANYIADMNLALHAWEENNMMRARELLDRHRPKPDETDLRGFEWHYLRRLFHRDRLTVNAHAGYALMVAFLPDGKRLISHGTSQRPPAGEFNNSLPGELKLWDATTGGRLPLQLKGPTDNVACAALSPDGKQLAAGYADKTVRVWDLDTNEGIALGDHHGAIFRVQFSPDGRHLVSVAADTNRPISLSEIPPSELKVWDLATRKAIITRANLPFVSLPPAFSPDGKLLACRSTIGGVIWVWDAATGQELHAFKDVPAGPSAVAFSPKGQRLSAGEYALKLWDVTTGSKDISHQLVSPAGACLAFSPDGKRLATTTFDGLLELWDSATGRRLRTFKGHAGLVESLAFSPDGRSLASAGADGTLKVWDTTGESEAIPIPGATTTPEGGLWLSHDGQKAVTGFQSKTIQVWDAATGKPRCAPLEHEHRVTNMDSTSDGKWLALADAGKNVKLWDMDTGRAIRTFQGHAEAISDLAISREGKWIAVWCKGGTLNLWDVEKGTDPRTIEGLRDDLGSGGFGPEGARLVGTSFKGAIRVVDVPTGQVALSLRLNDLVILISTLSPDGKRLAVTGFVPGFLTGEVRILDAASGREVMPRLRGHNFGVRALAFSPDGLRLATGSGDKTVKIWDMTSGQETLTLKGHTDQINSIAFSPDGRRLISASWDHTVRVWDATPLPDE